MQDPPFSYYRVDNVITDESAAVGAYASSEPTDTTDTDLRGALDALESDCLDNIEQSRDGTIICYPADYHQNMRTGDYEASELIIHTRHAHWADRLLSLYFNRNR